jgi:PAS domain-containing protein
MNYNTAREQDRIANKNLNEIISCIKKYANGDFTEKITITEEGGEFNELGSSLNSLVDKVNRIMEEKQEAIKKRDEYKEELNQYKNHLGYKVALRTEKLERELIERRKREEKLMENEARLNEALGMAGLGYWSFDLKQNRLYLSNEVCQLFEIEPKQFDGSFNIFMEFIHPEDRGLFYNSYIESVKNGEARGINHRIQLKNDKIKYVHSEWKTYYDSQGNALNSFGTLQDITEHR